MNELTGLLERLLFMMDHADVLHALREVGRMEDSLGDKESSTLERLRDGQVKLGAARFEQYAGG
jgi:hypothetical protein